MTRTSRNRLNALKIEREKARLDMDKAKLAQTDPTHLSFADQAAQMSATEFVQYYPTPTEDEHLAFSQEIAPMLKMWISEFGELLLMIYDQNRAAGDTEHRTALKEWADGLASVEKLAACLTQRDLPATSRFDYNPTLGGTLETHAKKAHMTSEDYQDLIAAERKSGNQP